MSHLKSVVLVSSLRVCLSDADLCNLARTQTYQAAEKLFGRRKQRNLDVRRQGFALTSALDSKVHTASPIRKSAFAQSLAVRDSKAEFCCNLRSLPSDAENRSPVALRLLPRLIIRSAFSDGRQYNASRLDTIGDYLNSNRRFTRKLADLVLANSSTALAETSQTSLPEATQCIDQIFALSAARRYCACTGMRGPVADSATVAQSVCSNSV